MSRHRKTTIPYPPRRLFSAEEEMIVREAIAQGVKPFEVAVKIGRTRKAVSQCMSRIRKAMKREQALSAPAFVIRKTIATVPIEHTPPIMSDTFRRLSIVADSHWMPATRGRNGQA